MAGTARARSGRRPVLSSFAQTRKDVAMYDDRNGGHAPGHVRDCFDRGVEAFYRWKGVGPEPTVEFEVHYEPRSVSLSDACGLVWNCTDIMPSRMVVVLDELDLESNTYAAGARAMHRWITQRSA